eukprot:GFKZ01005583.1.p1 GENE.GFKZ01005583.1~~GFKZ01005583.1.p1  ORF type:complete len:165 (+),score=10.51 GFKZ01005583.1:303-797(+)
MQVLGSELLRAAGVGIQCEVNHVLLRPNAKPANILVQPLSDVTETSLHLPVVYDITVSSLVQQSLMYNGTREARVPEVVVETRNVRDTVSSPKWHARHEQDDLNRDGNAEILPSIRQDHSPYHVEDHRCVFGRRHDSDRMHTEAGEMLPASECGRSNLVRRCDV